VHANDVPAVARALLFVTAALWVVAEVRQSTVRRTGARVADRGSRSVLRVATIVGIVLASVGARAAPGLAIGAPATVAWCGLVLMWCGIGLRLWCFRTLGRYFTFTVQTSGDQPVITQGPYRVIRHPSYAGIMLAVLGIGLLSGNWLSLAALVVSVAIGVVYRIDVEDRALLSDLGDDYREYAATHKRLVPYVW
jgi:protein-S-isoprenylcysteine O-methyltransferase Ste14